MNRRPASTSWPLLDLNADPEMEVDGPPALAPPAPAPAAPPPAPRNQQLRCDLGSVRRIFREYQSRRAALIRAVTTDEEELFEKCNPSLEPLQLYGNIDGSWEVREPEEDMPPRLPEPTLGINLERDKMERDEWLQHIAMHCDAWLISVAFFMGAEILNTNGREHLFRIINSLQTVYEAFMDSDTYIRLCQSKEERIGAEEEDTYINIEDYNIDTSIAADEDDEMTEVDEVDKEDEYEEEEEEEEDKEEADDSIEMEGNNDSICQLCGSRYHGNGFWICCDVCNGWYHGKCVRIKEDEAEHLEHFICPECKNENTGHDDD